MLGGTRFCGLSGAFSRPYTGLSSNARLAVDLGGGPNTAGAPAEGSEAWARSALDAEIGGVTPVFRRCARSHSATSIDAVFKRSDRRANPLMLLDVNTAGRVGIGIESVISAGDFGSAIPRFES